MIARISIRLVALAFAFTATLPAIAADEPKFTPQQQARLEEAQKLNTQIVQLFGKGNYAEAVPLAQQVLTTREQVLGPEHSEVAVSLNYLARLYDSQGKYAQAEPLYQRAAKIAETALGTDHPQFANYLNNLAELYRVQGKLTEAEPLYRRALTITEKALGADHPSVATSLNNLALLYHAEGQYSQAEPLLLRAIEIREKSQGPDHKSLAANLSNLSELYREQGKFAQAEPLCQRAITICEKNLGRDHPGLGTPLNNLALIYYGQGKYDLAEPLYQRALKIQEIALGPNHPAVAIALNNLAVLYQAKGEFSEVDALYQRSLKIQEAALGSDHAEVAVSLNNLAELYKIQDRYAQAEPLARRALKISESALGPGHPFVAKCINNLADLYRLQGEYAQAEPLYQQAVQIKKKSIGTNHPSLALAYGNLSNLEWAIGEWTSAAKNEDQARRIVRRHMIHELPFLSTQEQLAFLQITDEAPFHAALSLGLSRRDDSETAELSSGWLANGKGVAQEALTQNILLARTSDDPEVDATATELLDVRRQLAALTYLAPSPSLQADRLRQTEELQGQEEKLAKRLAQVSSQEFQADPWIDAAAVRKAVPPNAVLIDIARFNVFNFRELDADKKYQPAHYAAWVIPPIGNGEICIVDLGEARLIDEAVRTARRAIQDAGLREDRGLGSVVQAEKGESLPGPAELEATSLRALAKLIFEPLETKIGAARRLVISPDASLWLVPWAALTLRDGKYATEKYEISYAISARDLVIRPNNKKQSTSSVVFANPDFDLPSAKVASATQSALQRAARADDLVTREVSNSTIGNFQVPRLPGTAVEAAAITPRLKQYCQAEPQVYLDQYALEGVCKAVKSPRVLVLSTHGFYLPDQLVKRDERGRASEIRSASSFTVSGKPLESPLLRCGLLLAGCNQSASSREAASMATGKRRETETAVADDGILTGIEIVGVDLRGTELVVLSACETGLGKVQNGESVAGLRQAFQLAGAKSVVATLWQIPDQESALLMSQFFTNLAAGQSKSAALRNAQLTQIESLRKRFTVAPPFFWAAFTITGEQ